jgi:hypothetical protein
MTNGCSRTGEGAASSFAVPNRTILFTAIPDWLRALARQTAIGTNPRGMSEYRVKSWSDLQERLYADSWQQSLGRHRSPFAFRGMDDAGMNLVTSLARLGGDFAKTEPFILRSFRKYVQSGLPSFHGDSLWNWLALAQHHGLPTRMLDWTYSPNVALHFATADMRLFDRDGVVWCVDYVQTNSRLPQALKEILSRESAGVFTAEMLDAAANSLSALNALSRDDEPFVIFLEPPSLDHRIVNQFALFSLMSSATSRLDHWLQARPELFHRLVIPKELKWEVRDKLDQTNVNERVLFPGLDGLSAWLKRYYTARTGLRDESQDVG